MENSVQDYRKRARLSLEELADNCNVSKQTINAIEAGRFVPSVTTALRIARYLGTSVEDLFHL